MQRSLWQQICQGVFSMKSMLGVALAVATSSCALIAGINQAQAYSYQIDTSGYVDRTGGSGYFSVNFSTDKSGPGYFSYNYYTGSPYQYGQYGMYLNYYLTGFGDGTSYFSKNIVNGRVEGFSVTVDAKKADLTETLTGSDDPNNDFSRSFQGDSSVTLQYSRIDYHYPGASYFDYTAFNLDYIYFDGGRLFANPNAGSDQLASDTFLLSVPLPASAPLLGAALLVLGGVGYARRRVVGA